MSSSEQEDPQAQQRELRAGTYGVRVTQATGPLMVQHDGDASASPPPDGGPAKTALREFSQLRLRELATILLLDVSGSMGADGKIEALNQSAGEMISTLADADGLRAEIQLAVITFGGTARLHVPLQSVAAVKWQDMQAGGKTPMGQAMHIAADLIEDRDLIPARAYRPTVVLVSDGLPTDDWQAGLECLTRKGRAQKAHRMALGVGADADEAMLTQFLADPEAKVFHAEDAGKIETFLRLVTMSVTARSRNANRNQIPQTPDTLSIAEF